MQLYMASRDSTPLFEHCSNNKRLISAMNQLSHASGVMVAEQETKLGIDEALMAVVG